jgi:hypothetical protein
MSQEKRKSTRISSLSYRDDPAVRDLLNHVAEELAAEYVRLVRSDRDARRPSAARLLRLRRRDK